MCCLSRRAQYGQFRANASPYRFAPGGKLQRLAHDQAGDLLCIVYRRLGSCPKAFRTCGQPQDGRRD